MSLKDNFRKVVINLLKKYLAIPESSDKSLGTPKNILVIRQHNQFGDMLVSVSLFRAIKETYPECHLTLLASRENYVGIVKNKFIDRLFVFDSKKIFKLSYIKELKKTLKDGYDVVIVPATISISFTSCLLAALSDAKEKIGPLSLNGKKNEYAYMFNHRIELDWRATPDAHYADCILEIVRPFKINTKNLGISISFDDEDAKAADEFIESLNKSKKSLLIGMHIGAGKPQNRWPLNKYINLIERINGKYDSRIYVTGSFRDQEEIDYLNAHSNIHITGFLNRTIPQFAALISKTDIFITNDTGIMHVAGATATPQISIFGPTNPFNWAPFGPTKYFLRKSELISDVSVDAVFDLFNYLLEKQKNEKH
ncbi:MAG: glycosyltransferase family 9 protein [Melioribacteraceae bacterium]